MATCELMVVYCVHNIYICVNIRDGVEWKCHTLNRLNKSTIFAPRARMSEEDMFQVGRDHKYRARKQIWHMFEVMCENLIRLAGGYYWNV